MASEMGDSTTSRLTASDKGPARDPANTLRHQLTPWLLDIASLLISLACVLTVIALLVHFEGQAPPSWHGVTLNTFIGYLAQIAQVCLTAPVGNAISQLKWSWFWREAKPRRMKDFQLYDAASRGPLGALSVVFMFGKWPMTSLGAAISIGALVIHPFLQTIPIVLYRPSPSADTATVGVATSFFGVTMSTQDTDEGLTADNVVYQMDLQSKAAAYAGLFGYTSNITMPSTCTSGNCSWAPYTSLGVCSDCEDVSNLTTSTWVDGYDTENLQWTLPNGASIVASDSTMVAANDYPALWFDHLARYSIVNLTTMSYPPGTFFGSSPPTAIECILYLCVNKYVASVNGGHLTETPVWTFPNRSTNF